MDVLLRTCKNPILSTASSFQCAGTCKNGSCQAPYCGDGKIDLPTEQCDNGANNAPLSGCEPDCLRSGVVGIATGVASTCGLLVDGWVRCWGDNSWNELGLGENTTDWSTTAPYQIADVNGDIGPINFGPNAVVTSLAAGYYHFCALLQDQSIRCWGANESNQLGLGNVNDQMSTTPAGNGVISVSGSVAAVAAGGNNTCVLLNTGSVQCWGDNTYGQLGLGIVDAGISKPTEYGTVSLGGPATAISVGVNLICALLESGNIRCWGQNQYGGCGIGATTGTNAAGGDNANIGNDELPSAVGPVPLPPGRTATAVTAGWGFACARLDNGAVQCWGGK